MYMYAQDLHGLVRRGDVNARDATASDELGIRQRNDGMRLHRGRCGSLVLLLVWNTGDQRLLMNGSHALPCLAMPCQAGSGPSLHVKSLKRAHRPIRLAILKVPTSVLAV